MNANMEENKQQSDMEYHTFSVFSPIKKCPKCNGELEKGYMHAARGIYWDTTRHKVVGAMGESLKSQWSWTIPYAPALRCPICRLAIFYYGEGYGI